MKEMNLKELTELWKARQDLFSKWQKALIQKANALRDIVAKLLDVPDDYWESQDAREQRRYVEIIDISEPEKPVARSFSPSAITDKGELVFGLSFTFDNGRNTYPKCLHHVAIGIRFFQKKPQFCFWDTKTRQPMVDSPWQSDIDNFGNEILQMIERHFRFDPFDDFQNKPPIGFVQD